MILVKLLFLLLFICLAITVTYFLVVAIAGRFGKLRVYRSHPLKKKIAVIIPSFKEDDIIVDTAQQAILHNYPADSFEVIVVADKLKPETVGLLRQLPVTVLEVDLNMKSKSVHAAFQWLNADDYDIAVLLDADNIMQAGCLEKINDAFQQGCRAVQCHRTAKNQQTAVAVLDAVSEAININLFRRGPAVLGIGAAPVGSGMAFEFALLKEIFMVEHILNNPGEDREIDMQLMKKRIFMHFIDSAYIYDEKVASSAVFEKQRVRWLEAQVNHVRRFSDKDMKDAPRTAVYFIKYFQNLLLPRLLLILLLGIFLLIAVCQWLFSFSILLPAGAWWIGVSLLYVAVLVLSVPAYFYSLKTLRAMLQVPVLMLAMLRALFKMKSGRKEFLHTSKTYRK